MSVCATAAIERQLRHDPGVGLLCKFRSSSDPLHMDALANGYLWAPDILSLNDPFDSKPKALLTSESLAERNAYCDAVRSAGVICFSGQLTGRRRELLLWAHYAAGHTGFCLLIRDQFLSENTHPVVYPKTYPDLAGITPASPDFWERTGFFKARCWAYENERRVLFPGKANSVHRLKPGAIWGVIFGCWSLGDHRRRVAALALQHSPNCEFFEARIRVNEFDIWYQFATPTYASVRTGRPN